MKYQEEAALGMNQRIKNLEKQLNDEAEHNELLKQQVSYCSVIFCIRILSTVLEDIWYL